MSIDTHTSGDDVLSNSQDDSIMIASRPMCQSKSHDSQDDGIPMCMSKSLYSQDDDGIPMCLSSSHESQDDSMVMCQSNSQDVDKHVDVSVEITL